VLPAGSYLVASNDLLTGYLDDCRISSLDDIRIRVFFSLVVHHNTGNLLSL
jgi:hypothetical protein